MTRPHQTGLAGQRRVGRSSWFVSGSHPRSRWPAAALLVGAVRAGRAARRDRAVHQPGLLVLPARRQADRRNTRTIPRVIAMSLAVDYWDYLGWKDTLALTGHSNRQRAYAKARGDRAGLYAAGGDRRRGPCARQRQGGDRAARSGRRREQSAPLPLPVKIEQSRRQADRRRCRRPRMKRARPKSGCARSPRSIPVAIGRGENSGHTITYTNVVRRWIKLGDWTGKAETFNVPVKDFQTGRHRFGRRAGAERRRQRAEADARRRADRTALNTSRPTSRTCAQ